MPPAKIMKKTQWKHERGADPSRVVILKHFTLEGKVKEYSTHLQVDHRANPGGKLAFYSGHYFRTLANAKTDFANRMRKEGLGIGR